MSIFIDGMDSLQDLANAGYCTKEWDRWQDGRCGTYALALAQLCPDFEIGNIDSGAHWFAHDSEYAYDSAGQHPLSYTGLYARYKSAELHVPVRQLQEIWWNDRDIP